MKTKESLLKGELMFSYKVYFADGSIWYLDTCKDPLEVCEVIDVKVVSVETIGKFVGV